MPYCARKTEITFLGVMTRPPRRVLCAARPFFSRTPMSHTFCAIELCQDECYQELSGGVGRNALLNDSRILLTLHYSEQKYFEWHRALVALANGCCLITETSEGYADLVPGRHFVMAEPDDLIPCCEYYLRIQERRRRSPARATISFEPICDSHRCVQIS